MLSCVYRVATWDRKFAFSPWGNCGVGLSLASVEWVTFGVALKQLCCDKYTLKEFTKLESTIPMILLRDKCDKRPKDSRSGVKYKFETPCMDTISGFWDLPARISGVTDICSVA